MIIKKPRASSKGGLVINNSRKQVEVSMHSINSNSKIMDNASVLSNYSKVSSKQSRSK